MKNGINTFSFLIILALISIETFAQHNNAFRFTIIGNNYSDETVIRMLNGASQNFDSNYDAWKLFSPNPNVPSIYTNDPNGSGLSINSLPEFIDDNSITIYTNIPAAGSYTINFEEIFITGTNYKLSLTESSSNTHYRLLGDTALTFYFNAQQHAPSFTFNISTPPTHTEINESCTNMNDGIININNSGNNDWLAEIINSNQSILHSTLLSVDSINFNALEPGNYIARITSKGIIDEFPFTIAPGVNITAAFNMNADTIYLSEGGNINFTNNSLNAETYSWEFGDGNTSTSQNPSHSYDNTGDYSITLTALHSSCMSDTTKELTVLETRNIFTGIESTDKKKNNIANLGNANYRITTNSNSAKISVHNIEGRLMLTDNLQNSNYNLSLSNYPSGIYILNVELTTGDTFTRKIFR